MLAARNKDTGHHTPPTNDSSASSQLNSQISSPSQCIADPQRQVSGTQTTSWRPGFLMECATSSDARACSSAYDHIEAERISSSILRSLEAHVNNLDGSNPTFGRVSEAAVALAPAVHATYPLTRPAGQYMASRDSVPELSPQLSEPQLYVPAASVSNSNIPGCAPVSRLGFRGATTSRASLKFYEMSPQSSRRFSMPQIDCAVDLLAEFRAMCEHIWRYNDQKTSLYLQERLRCCIPGEYEHLVAAIFENVMPLMVHRFGNFLVQWMLQLSNPEEIAAFAKILEGHIAELSKDQFCCHVIQRLLDVGSIVVQATIAAELLDDVVSTMCSDSGSHVWQKLLHLPWKYDMPPITVHVNNAVHLPPNEHGWLTIAKTEAGCATIKSFLGVNFAGPERQHCLNELSGALEKLLVDPIGSVLVSRIAMIAASRTRTITAILSHAREYARHPVASGVLITILHFKIPSFPSRLGGALAPFRAELRGSPYGKQVLAALDQVKGRHE